MKPPPHAQRESQEKVYLLGSLVSASCGNSMGQVMEKGVMMHQQHQPLVAPPAEAADGTHDWRGAITHKCWDAQKCLFKDRLAKKTHLYLNIGKCRKY